MHFHIVDVGTWVFHVPHVPLTCSNRILRQERGAHGGKPAFRRSDFGAEGGYQDVMRNAQTRW